MNILESFIYGLVSGLSEFLPISSQGHQALLKYVFGNSTAEPIRDIFIHFAMLLAVIVSSATYIDRMKRERKIRRSRKRGMQIDRTVTQEMRLIRTAAIPMILGMIFYFFTGKLGSNAGWLTIFFILNGIILYVPEHMTQANKNAGQLGPMDAILIGLFGGLSCLTGVSRVGSSLSCAIGRGAERSKAYNWILIMSIPALILLLIFDVISIFANGFGGMSFMAILGYFVSGITAFGSAFAGIYFMRRLLAQSAITFFAFYCWAAAFLSFFLYLFA